MGFATVYCHKCGSQVLGAELEKGHAVTRGDKYYCAECVPLLPPETAAEAHDRKGSTRFRKPGESTRNTDIIRNLQAMGGGRGNTTRVAAISPQEQGGMGNGAKAGLAIGGVAVLALVGFIMSQMSGSGGSGAGGTKPDSGKAKAAYEAAESLRKSGNAKAWVEAAQKARKEASGTEYEERAAANARDAQAALAAEEKADALLAEIKRTAADARAAEDPMTYEPAFRDLMARAKKDAPAHLALAESTWNEIAQAALLKPLGKIDISMAATPAGFRRVKEDLDEVSKKATAAGAAGKTALEAVAKKLKEAQDKFQSSADPALADLEKRVMQMIADGLVDEADRAVSMFMADYAGTTVADKAAPLKDKVAARRKELDAGWIEAVEGDWKKELGDMKATWSGKEISFVCDGPAGAGLDKETDKSRRIIFAKADDKWTDYDLEFEVNVETYGGLLVTRLSSKEPHPFNFVPAVGAQPGLPAGQWFKINLRLKGNQITVSGPNIPTSSYATTSTAGSFSFTGFKGSKFKLRNIRARKLK